MRRNALRLYPNAEGKPVLHVKRIREPMSDIEECPNCYSARVKKVDESSYYCKDCGTITTWKDRLLNPRPKW